MLDVSGIVVKNKEPAPSGQTLLTSYIDNATETTWEPLILGLAVRLRGTTPLLLLKHHTGAPTTSKFIQTSHEIGGSKPQMSGIEAEVVHMKANETVLAPGLVMTLPSSLLIVKEHLQLRCLFGNPDTSCCRRTSLPLADLATRDNKSSIGFHSTSGPTRSQVAAHIGIWPPP
ncbi:hypothetical protein BV22DRAFT_149381 [Leucogyrophana mollusca]|uniref:Uncharacterized protein n=1 Tax=Leucogyrophana mollusca TaxID=85980 RepID=A0ACB8BUU5_9AGAM|nr:hypothetical protein BV22DRAFT_149381 [Leucogyrophana mollusca]